MILLLINNETYCLADSLDIDNSTISGNYDLDFVMNGIMIYRRLVEADGVGLSGNMFSILDSIYNRRLCESFPSPGDRVVDILNGNIYDVVGRDPKQSTLFSNKLKQQGLQIDEKNAAEIIEWLDCYMYSVMLMKNNVRVYDMQKDGMKQDFAYLDFIKDFHKTLKEKAEALDAAKPNSSTLKYVKEFLKVLDGVINEEKETVLRSLTITYADYRCIKNAVEKGCDSSGILYHILSLVEDEFEK